MSESVKLTEAQRRTLKAIDKGVVVWDRLDQRWRSTDWPPSARRDVVQRVVDVGFAERGESRGMAITDVVLTVVGREALAASQETER